MRAWHAALVLAVIVCVPPVAWGQSPARDPAAAFEFTTPDLELLDLANQFDKVMREKGLVLEDPKATAYLTAVGNLLAGSQPPPERVTWNYRVLRDPVPNAFALPNGSIYVHSGLLGLLQNESQLAAVLAHEKEHVLCRHPYLDYRSYRKKMVGLHALEAIAAGGYFVGGVGAGSAALAADVASIFVVLSVFGYSRELEHQADVRGLEAMEAAGYSGQEMVQSLRLLQSGYEVHLEKEPRFYADHPKLQDRIDYLSKLARPSVAPGGAPPEAGPGYLPGTEATVRQDVPLQIRAGRPRSAVAEAERVARLQPGSSENSLLVAEAWRALGPRTPQPQPEELTEKFIEHTRKLVRNLTLQEYEAKLLSEPGGAARLEASDTHAEAAYRQAITEDSSCAKCYRGLGFLYERQGRYPDAIQALSKYLELAPTAIDRAQVLHRVQVLEASPAARPAHSGKE